MIWIYVGMLVGILFRTIAPWLIRKLQDPSLLFDRKYFWQALVAMILCAPLALMALPALAAKLAADWWANLAIGMTWAFTLQSLLGYAQSAYARLGNGSSK